MVGPDREMFCGSSAAFRANCGGRGAILPFRRNAGTIMRGLAALGTAVRHRSWNGGEPNVASMVERIGNHIAGEWVESGNWQESRNPSDLGDLIALHAEAGPDEVERAVVAASEAFPSWAAMPTPQRSEILNAIGNDIIRESVDIARLISREEGKTLGESHGEVTFAGEVFRYYAMEAVRAGGETGRSLKDKVDVEVVHEPVGVFGLITPWNFPLLIPAWKAAPALAYGNCAILKPSELTNGGAIAFMRILARHLPRGVLQLVMGSGPSVGMALCSHRDVAGVSFTGSVATGAKIAAAVHARHARLQMEMGGKNPLVVLADANLEAAVDAAIRGSFHATGQRCTASSRIIVEEPVYDRFAQRLIERMESLRVGHAMADDSDLGPLVSRSQLERVEGYVERGRADGLHLVGGRRLSRPTEGHYFSPGLFLDTENRHPINQEEIFGPVTALQRASSFEHAIELANDTPFGLSAGIFTDSLSKARAFKKVSRAGMVMVNLPTFGSDYHVPFGGRGISSYGVKEMGTSVRDFFTISKTIYVA
jgi:alpha-ketoglutaric semialdehyde dehydrogenase